MSEDIYQIPLSFEITGQKGNITDFIYFFQHVGAIRIENDNFEVYSDRFMNRVIEGDQRAEDYNIYEKQIADISGLSWSEYPDSSGSVGDESNILSLLKGRQSRERTNVEIDLQFYVA